MVLPRKHHVNVPCQHVDMVLSRSDSLTPRKHHVNTLLQNLGRGVERMVRCLWNCVKMHVPMPPVLPPPPLYPGPPQYVAAEKHGTKFVKLDGRAAA